MPTTMTYLSTNADGVLSKPPLTKESVIGESEPQAYIDGKAEEQFDRARDGGYARETRRAILEATKASGGLGMLSLKLGLTETKNLEKL